MKIKKLLIVLIVFIVVWFIPTPTGLSSDAWHLFAIFISVIIGIIIEAMPIGAMGLLGIALVAITGVTNSLPGKNISNALAFLSSSFIWLIVLATIMSRAIINSGLGNRIAYYLLILFGKNTLGVGYALTFSEFILSPFTPSNTARCGGIMHPIMKGVANSLDSHPNDDSRLKAGRFLAMVNYNTNPITSAMFITATAPNPIIVKAVSSATNGAINLTWTVWALAMLLPGIIALIIMPLVVSLIYPPKIKKLENVKEFARNKLKEAGKMHFDEKMVIAIFAFLLIFWAKVPNYLFGFGLGTTTTILVGVVVLVLTNVLKWEDVLAEKAAWSSLIWFASLVMMATYLDKLGFIGWFSEIIKNNIQSLGIGTTPALIILILVYTYSHYLFASTTAHISAMYATFYVVGISLGANPMQFALILAASSSIMMHLTHYATGTSPIIFSSGYIKLKEWWIIGFILSVVTLIIFFVVGSLWWKLLGLV